MTVHDRSLDTMIRREFGDDVSHEAAYRSALRDMRRENTARLKVPDPWRVAANLSEIERHGLRTARRCCNGWQVGEAYVPDLRTRGIVEVGGAQPNLRTHNYLTVFGMKVRRAVLAEDG